MYIYGKIQIVVMNIFQQLELMEVKKFLQELMETLEIVVLIDKQEVVALDPAIQNMELQVQDHKEHHILVEQEEELYVQLERTPQVQGRIIGGAGGTGSYSDNNGAGNPGSKNLNRWTFNNIWK